MFLGGRHGAGLQVMSRTGEMYAQYSDAPADGTTNLSRTMFPPADGVALGLPRWSVQE